MPWLDLIVLALAACGAGIGGGAITDILGKRWGIGWSIAMLWLLVALAVL